MHKELRLDFDIQAQPDEITCGPTCLQALYNYYNDAISLEDVIKQVRSLRGGGTLAVMLGSHALKRGYKATIYTYNLNVFDPSWFQFSSKRMIKFLKEQMLIKAEREKLKAASKGYIRFLKLGGELRYAELDKELIKGMISKSIPILTGLSATYLYGTPRETPDNIYDSTKGDPAGHFVVINGYDDQKDWAYLADPMTPNPLNKGQIYGVNFNRLINSIMLGIITYDANLLVIEPTNKMR